MKGIFQYLPKKALVAIATIFAIIGIGTAVQAGFGPDRPTYTMANPADHITFNSITDNPVAGDERAFLTASAPGEAYTDPVTSLQNNDEITLRMYVHNDAAANLNLKATNTKVRVALPTGSKQQHTATGYISADNATPKEVSDTLDLKTANGGFFELEYITGSAMWKNNVFTTGTKLSDSIVTTGALVGYDKIDGILPGCAEFSGWVTLKLRVKMPHYTVQKTARLAGEGTDAWRETVNAKVGDTVEWRIDIKNIGSTQLDNIIVSDLLPANMTAEKGSVKLIDSNFPPSNPYVYPDSAISVVNGKLQVNVDTGNYPAGANAVVTFKSKVLYDEVIKCGAKLENKAYATPKGYGSIVDNAIVSVAKTDKCEQEKPVYSCDALSVAVKANRVIEAKVTTTATGGAKLSTITYDFGDNSDKLITDKTVVGYTYAKDGSYTIKAVPSFVVNGKTVTAVSDNCVKIVKISTDTPHELPNTGPGAVAGIFASISAAATAAYQFVARRR